MHIDLKLFRFERSDKRYWRQRWVFMRPITIGGYKTGEKSRSIFVIAGRFWTRRSKRYNRWLYREHRPSKYEEV
jgi:uncharacterized membrane protein YbaN (DUF454 family)